MRDCTAAARDGEGFVFLSLEDETGIANIILAPMCLNRIE